MLTALKPVIADNDPLPAEIVGAADTVCHAAGDLLMRTSGICGAMRRAGGTLDRIEEACRLAAREAELMAQSTLRIAETIAALRERGGR
ncbi:MAG: hypothetical protein DI537_08600 [Stutzerimonas stutzeri]|nr:MAG: hypothetical protein DI537_08600 [Stutzerimonas stutzeri]